MSPSHGRRALALRIFGDFALRWLEMSIDAFQGDVEGAAVYYAVLQANVLDVARDPVLNRTWGTTPPPDDLRTPVSLREAARSLGMPRERFRRKAVLLAAADAFDIGDDGGVIVPGRSIRPPTSRRHWRDVGVFHRRLQRSGFEVADIPATTAPDVWRQAILRNVGEVFVAWARLAPAPLQGRILLATTFAAILQANDYPPPDALEAAHAPRPIAVNALALSLRMPRESVRRYVAQLEAAGWVVRGPDGITASDAILDSDAIAFVDPLMDLTRTIFQRLADHGVEFSPDFVEA